MRQLLNPLILAISLLVAAAATAAADSVVPGESIARSVEVSADSREETPRTREIRDAMESERETLEELYEEFRNARDHKQALKIQRRIARTKQQTEIDILYIQARHARIDGRLEVAHAIEAQANGLQEKLDERLPQEPEGGR